MFVTIGRIKPCLGPSKSLSRNVVCQCEPVVTTIVLCLIGTRRVGAGVGIRFLPDVVSNVIKDQWEHF